MKISKKLILTFGILISILVVEIIINQIITNKAVSSYEELNQNIYPTIQMLDDFEAINKEILLLSNNQLVNNKPIHKSKLKAITEVSLPNLKDEIYLLQKKLEKDNPISKLSRGIIISSDKILQQIERLNSPFLAKTDNKINSKQNSNLKVVENLISEEMTTLNKKIKELTYIYDLKLINGQDKISNELSSISSIILYTGILGIIISLLIAIKTITSITKPINILKAEAKKITNGEYNTRIKLAGNNELTELSDTFNSMAMALKVSFSLIDKKNSKLLDANKELNQFAFIASHDLQEPLRTMINYCNVLEEDYSDRLDDEGKLFLNYIINASARMKNLINDLLMFSRLENNKIKMETINLPNLIEDVKLDLKDKIEKLEAKIEIENIPDQIRGNRNLLYQLFLNLISNGLKYQAYGNKPIVKINSKFDNQNTIFEVKDNGIGIDEKYFKKIFEIFQRLHKKGDYEGTGIGLATCKKIVNLHKGEIWLSSKPNVGSSFFFSINN